MTTPSLNLKVLTDLVAANISSSSQELPVVPFAALQNNPGAVTFDLTSKNLIISDGTTKYVFYDVTTVTALINSILTTDGLNPFLKIQVAVLGVNIPNNRIPANSPVNTTFSGFNYWPPSQAASLASRIGNPAPGIGDFLANAGERWNIALSIAGCITTGSANQSGSTRVQGVLVANNSIDIATLGTCTCERIAAQPDAFGIGVPPTEVILNGKSGGALVGNFEETAPAQRTYSINITLAGDTGVIEVSFNNYVSVASNNIIFTRYLP